MTVTASRAAGRRRTFSTWSLGALLAVPGWCALRSAAQQTAMTTLGALKNQYRPLLIFAPRPDDPQLEIQMRTLQEHAPEVQERDLAVIALPNGGP